MHTSLEEPTCSDWSSTVQTRVGHHPRDPARPAQAQPTARLHNNVPGNHGNVQELGADLARLEQQVAGAEAEVLGRERRATTRDLQQQLHGEARGELQPLGGGPGGSGDAAA